MDKQSSGRSADEANRKQPQNPRHVKALTNTQANPSPNTNEPKSKQLNTDNKKTNEGEGGKVPDEGAEGDNTTSLGMVEFKVYIDLYKFFLKLCLSVNVFYLGLLGGLLTFLFRPVDKEPGTLLTFVFPPAASQQSKLLIDTLIPPVKVALLVTPFILGCVLMLAFAMGGTYWLVSTREINKHIKKPIGGKDKGVKLLTTPFFHLLTFLLAAVTIIFMFVTYLLGTIMAKYGILFCDGCSLRRERLLGIAGAALIVAIFLIIRYIIIRYIKKPAEDSSNDEEPAINNAPPQDTGKDTAEDVVQNTETKEPPHQA